MKKGISLGFRFKEDDEDFVSHKELLRGLGDDYISPCSLLTYEADRKAAKQRILERRFPERIQMTPIMMQTKGVAKTLKLLIFLYLTIVILFYSSCKEMPSSSLTEFFSD